jgi:hypothetical protein
MNLYLFVLCKYTNAITEINSQVRYIKNSEILAFNEDIVKIKKAKPNNKLNRQAKIYLPFS